MIKLFDVSIELPILYSFRRCPYAIRARMAIAVSGQNCELREVVLRSKPAEMLEVSPKGTVPVLVLSESDVIEESMDIMHWALDKNDPDGWLITNNKNRKDFDFLIAENDGAFKDNLDKYKYSARFESIDPNYHRAKCLTFLKQLNDRLSATKYLCSDRFSIIDAAISPFVRQFANTDREWFDALDLPGIHRWLHLILGSDLFVSVMTKYPTWINFTKKHHFPNPQ